MHKIYIGEGCHWNFLVVKVKEQQHKPRCEYNRLLKRNHKCTTPPVTSIK